MGLELLLVSSRNEADRLDKMPCCVEHVWWSFFGKTVNDKKLHLKYYNEEREVLASQPAITCSKLAIETLQQGVKYVQS